MEDLSKKIILLGLTIVIAGCGVKGRPVPPKNPPPLGRGEPTLKETTKKKTDGGTTVISEESAGR